MKKVINFFKKLNRTFMKLNIWCKTALFLTIILVILLLINKHVPKIEGFTQREKFVVKEGTDVYDGFYTSIYDDLVLDKVKNDFEIGEIKRLIIKKGRVLDVGSGKGHHVNLLNNAGYEAEGVDISPAMIESAKEKYKQHTFKNGDVMETMLYPANSFSTVTCMYFTIYYMKDKNRFLQNVYRWLMPGGYFVIHLVNRDKFDPILNAADPLHIVSAQKHAKKRITNSLVKFKDFQYKANFDLDKSQNLANFEETLKDDKSGHVRQNRHKLYMEPQKHILSIAKNIGFILKGKIDMVSTQYHNQYLYLLYKPE
tara:strand:- start:41 stop:976 length:936 start_codon:yes stop_codon:yes gene_type:complete